MVNIGFVTAITAITVIWIAVRAFFWIKNRKISWKREAQLLLVYICIMVIARITFFPMEKIDGRIQPLVFDAAKAFDFRINLVPFVHLFEYDNMRDALLNFIGNTTMFIPVGIVWPSVFKKLDNWKKVLLAGLCFPLCIEILQLPFYDRVSDIDDLLLNFIGYLAGYGIFHAFMKMKKKKASV